MIHEVNSLSAPAASQRSVAEPQPGSLAGLRNGARTHDADSDPVAQIVAILNAHLGSLRWIDESAAALREKVENLRRGNTMGAAASVAPESRAGSVMPRGGTPGFRREGSVAPLGASLGRSRGYGM